MKKKGLKPFQFDAASFFSLPICSFSSLAKWLHSLAKICPRPYSWRGLRPYAWIPCFTSARSVRPTLGISAAWLAWSPPKKSLYVTNELLNVSFLFPFFHQLLLPFSCPSSSTCAKMVFGVFARPAPTCSCPSPVSARLPSASPNYLPSSPTCSRTSRDGYA